jgi:hypothetical protein
VYGILHDRDALWILAALVPLGIASAAWALQLACGFCSVDPPEFAQAVTTVVIIAVANAILRLVLQNTGYGDGIGAEYMAPLLMTSAVISLSVPTGPFVATTITAVELVLCAMIYCGLVWLHTVVAQSLSMLA